MASLPLLIYTELLNPEKAGQSRVWGAALTLILLVAVLYFAAALVSRWSGPQKMNDRSDRLWPSVWISKI